MHDIDALTRQYEAEKESILKDHWLKRQEKMQYLEKNTIITPTLENNRMRYEHKTYTNNQGEEYEIIRFYDFNNILIMFSTSKYNRFTSMTAIRNGQVRDPYYSGTITGGSLGIAFPPNAHKCSSPDYTRWKSMFDLAYDHIDIKICDYWKCYENFVPWFRARYYTIPDGYVNLNKDILRKHNDLYCPEYCCLVPSPIHKTMLRLNSAFQKKSNLPIGVLTKRKKFITYISQYGESKYYHSYDTAEEAFLAYKTIKEKYIKELANEYKSYLEPKVYQALMDYTIEITD